MACGMPQALIITGKSDILISSFTDNSTNGMCGSQWAHILMLVLRAVNQFHIIRLVFLD